MLFQESIEEALCLWEGRPVPAWLRAVPGTSPPALGPPHCTPRGATVLLFSRHFPAILNAHCRAGYCLLSSRINTIKLLFFSPWLIITIFFKFPSSLIAKWLLR